MRNTGYLNNRARHIHELNGEYYIITRNGTRRLLPNNTRVYTALQNPNNNNENLIQVTNVARLKAAAAGSPRYSFFPVNGVAKKAARKWLMGPARNVILPKGNNTLKAPVNLSFNRGNYAIRYTKRWMRNGNNKSVRLYYSIPTFERLANQKWPDIYRYPGSEIVMHHSPHLKSDETRVYRRNLALVRFV